ncbi:ABC transporter ATP-binding protein [Streptomyces sp. NPDC059095]|uniref:ABC transporter ATP-binding protein n=1 Tax=Streptomyces sp. NPDC059095 TaxID=3346726 RepID=UPI0036B9E82F
MSETRAAIKDQSATRSLLRLWPYVRPIRTRLFSAAFVAIVASCLGLVIPLVLKWIVDGPVADRDPGGVWLGALYLLLLGLAEAALFGYRRWLVARPLASVEAEMRADLYRHVQRLPVSFHDRWASGQLLSRGTTDLMLLRMFLAFPLTFLVVNAVTILAGFAILLSQQWSLGLVLLVPVIPLVVLCSLFETRYSLVARQAQDQVGDLTTVVEESVLGIRIIKGFGQHRSQALAFRELSERLRGTELAKARLLAGLWGLITTIPELAIGAALVLGTVQVADGDLSAGTLVAFLSTALALRWPVESIGFLLAMSQESATATARFFEAMDAQEEAEAPGASTSHPPGKLPPGTHQGPSSLEPLEPLEPPRGSAPGPASAAASPADRAPGGGRGAGARRPPARPPGGRPRTPAPQTPEGPNWGRPAPSWNPAPPVGRPVSGSKGSPFATPTPPTAVPLSSRASICTYGRARPWPWSAGPGRARPRSPRSCRGCTRSAAGGSRSTARTSRT